MAIACTNRSTASVEELYAAIIDTFARGGNVIIPTFALERAQELLYFLRAGVEQSRLPPSAQVYLDSPMAISATEIFERHPGMLSTTRPRKCSATGTTRSSLPGLHFTRDTAALDRDQQYPRRRHHHGGLRHGDRRAHPPSPQAQSLAPGMQRRFRRLCRGGNAGAPHHRRRAACQNSRRRYSGAGAHPHHQRLFGARRSGGALGLAQGDAGRPHLSRPRRGRLHAAIRREARPARASKCRSSTRHSICRRDSETAEPANAKKGRPCGRPFHCQAVARLRRRWSALRA